MIEYDYWTGLPNHVEGNLHRTIGALSRHWAFHQKVGITANPDDRWSRYYEGRGWKQMNIIYASDDHADVCYLERKLIDRFRAGVMTSPGYHHNQVGGGGGLRPAGGPYFLYVVGAPRYARLCA